MTNILLRRQLPHQMAITGDGTADPIDWNDVYEVNNMLYDASAKKVKALENGLYLATWSLPYGNLTSDNISGAGWFHGGTAPRNEPFIYNGNPWEMANNAGLIPGGGGNIIAICGAHTFRVDIEQDPWISIITKIGGSATKNVVLLYDAFFAVTKIGN